MKKIYVTTGFLITLLLASLTTFAQSQSRADILKEIEAKHKELAALEKSFLEPAEEDRLRYAEFLRSKNTGLIRLLPRDKYDSNLIRGMGRVTISPDSFSRPQLADLPQGQQTTEDTSVRARPEDIPGQGFVRGASKTGLSIRGGGAYYSFTQKTHEYGYGSDIQLQRGELSSGFAGVDYGLMVRLGDVPLETVGLDLPQANVLATYKPPSKEPEVRLEKNRLNENTEIDGLIVRRRQSLRGGSTYLLRSLNYGQSDVLIAFRVVRVDYDGSAIILWKLLKKFSPPHLARN